MFDWLFPTWSNPAAVAAIVALRLLLDVALVALVAGATGPRSRRTAGAAALVVLSAALVVSVLRPGGAGQFGSYLEFGFQASLLVLAGRATYSNPSTRRWLAFAGVVVGVVVLLVPTVVLYGEATVAP